MVPRCASVLALYSLQKSMIATPCGPRAVPTGGAGVAAPAGIWIFTTAETFFLAMFSTRPRLVLLGSYWVRTRADGVVARPTTLAVQAADDNSAAAAADTPGCR